MNFKSYRRFRFQPGRGLFVLLFLALSLLAGSPALGFTLVEESRPLAQSGTEGEEEIADLALTASSSDSVVDVGQQFTLNLSVRNLGDDDAYTVTVQDFLPAGVLYQNFRSNGPASCSHSSGTVTCTVSRIPYTTSHPTLPNPLVLKFEVIATQPGLQTNNGYVFHHHPEDPNMANNDDWTDITVRPIDKSIAYVYDEDDSSTALEFQNLLQDAGFSVDLIAMDDILATNFAYYDLIIIASNTGLLSSWGTAGQAEHIAGAGRPTLGIGEGGYAYFGRFSLRIGWPYGWHNFHQGVEPLATAPPFYYLAPNAFYPLPAYLELYTLSVPEVGIDVTTATGLTIMAYEVGDNNHSPLLYQGCSGLWGFEGRPSEMTDNGRKLFINSAVYTVLKSCNSGYQVYQPVLLR